MIKKIYGKIVILSLAVGAVRLRRIPLVVLLSSQIDTSEKPSPLVGDGQGEGDFSLYPSHQWLTKLEFYIILT